MMQSKHSTILKNVNKVNKNLNILTFNVHESYQSNWSALPHTFYLLNGKNMKKWEPKYRVLPQNHISLDGSPNQIKIDQSFDMIISMNKGADWQICQDLSQRFGIPILSINHVLPYYQWNSKQIEQFRSMRADLNIYITEYSMEKWGDTLDDPTVRILPHGINTDLFKPNPEIQNDGKILTVANLYKDRDWCLGYSIYERITKDLPKKHLGSSDDNSTYPAKNLDDLIQNYQSCGCFLNTSTISPVPTSLLESASCAIPIVTTATCQIPQMFTDKVNCFISNDESYLREKLEWCLNNPEQAKEIGKNAREMVLKDFSLNDHLKKVEKLFGEIL